MEFGNANVSGGGMTIQTDTPQGCSSPLLNLKPTTINIVDSTFQQNTADHKGGGLAIDFDSSEYVCCNAKVSITSITFLNNKANTVLYEVDGTEEPTRGGNILIEDSTGQWLNNSVRVHTV